MRDNIIGTTNPQLAGAGFSTQVTNQKSHHHFDIFYVALT